MRCLKFIPLLLCIPAVAGCKSPFIEATIVNRGPVLHVLEVDYPSASFGANQIAEGASFHYRFKVQGDGPLSLQYEDAEGHSHTAAGPSLAQGDEGTLLITITPAGKVTWSPKVSRKR